MDCRAARHRAHAGLLRISARLRLTIERRSSSLRRSACSPYDRRSVEGMKLVRAVGIAGRAVHKQRKFLAVLPKRSLFHQTLLVFALQ